MGTLKTSLHYQGLHTFTEFWYVLDSAHRAIRRPSHHPAQDQPNRIVQRTYDRHIYKDRNLVERFYNRTRRHSHLGGVSPETFGRASL